MRRDETKPGPFPWNQARERAAQLVYEDELTDEKIAAEVGTSRASLARWKKHPEFIARVEQHLAEFRTRVLRHGIAVRERRVAALNDRWERLRTVIEERAAAPEMQAVPGGRSGLITHSVKSVGRGDEFRLVDVYELDAVLLRECREHEKQAAQELGQWTETTTTGQDFRVELDLAAPDDPAHEADAAPT